MTFPIFKCQIFYFSIDGPFAYSYKSELYEEWVYYPGGYTPGDWGGPGIDFYNIQKDKV